MRTRILYLVKVNETAYVEMSVRDIQQMLNNGYQLTIRIVEA